MPAASLGLLHLALISISVLTSLIANAASAASWNALFVVLFCFLFVLFFISYLFFICYLLFVLFCFVCIVEQMKMSDRHPS